MVHFSYKFVHFTQYTPFFWLVSCPPPSPLPLLTLRRASLPVGHGSGGPGPGTVPSLSPAHLHPPRFLITMQCAWTSKLTCGLPSACGSLKQTVSTNSTLQKACASATTCLKVSLSKSAGVFTPCTATVCSVGKTHKSNEHIDHWSTVLPEGDQLTFQREKA